MRCTASTSRSTPFWGCIRPTNTTMNSSGRIASVARAVPIQRLPAHRVDPMRDRFDSLTGYLSGQVIPQGNGRAGSAYGKLLEKCAHPCRSGQLPTLIAGERPDGIVRGVEVALRGKQPQQARKPSIVNVHRIEGPELEPAMEGPQIYGGTYPCVSPLIFAGNAASTRGHPRASGTQTIRMRGFILDLGDAEFVSHTVTKCPRWSNPFARAQIVIDTGPMSDAPTVPLSAISRIRSLRGSVIPDETTFGSSTARAADFRGHIILCALACVCGVGGRCHLSGVSVVRIAYCPYVKRCLPSNPKGWRVPLAAPVRATGRAAPRSNRSPQELPQQLRGSGCSPVPSRCADIHPYQRGSPLRTARAVRRCARGCRQ